MYKFSTNIHKTGETYTQSFETLERAQMAMLEHMCRVVVANGMDWAQAGEMLLGLLDRASHGELSTALGYDVVDVVVSSHWCVVYTGYMSMSYGIEEVEE